MQAILLLVLSNMCGGPRHYSSGPVPSLWTPPTPEETMKLVELKLCSLPANEHLYFHTYIHFLYIPEDQQIECMKETVQSG
jgi:hypothetical protein